MGYGITVTGVDTANAEFYVIDSATTATKFLGLAAGGGDLWTSSSDDRNSAAGTEATPVDVPGYDATEPQLVFARPYDNTNEMYFNGDLQALTNVKTAVLTPIDDTSSFSSTVNGDNYGLQVLNSAEEIIFDSRLIDKGFEIQKAYDREKLTGGKYANTQGDIGDPATAPNFKHDTNLVYDGSALSEEQWKNTYVSINASHFNDDASTTNLAVFGGFYFEHNAVTTTDGISKPKQQIYFMSYFEMPPYVPAWAVPNMSAILIGELKK